MNDKVASHLLDNIGWKIVVELEQNARLPFAELGRRVGLSTPAVVERVRRLEEAGIIVGYHAEVDHRKIGLPLLAFVRITVEGTFLAGFAKKAAARPEVLEVHRVTGAESFIVKVAVTDQAHLEKVLDSLMPYVATTTSMVLSSSLTWRCLGPEGDVDSAAAPAT
jgi:Lrp/AsnC family leucine-responsive transcriptional regulator